MELDARMQLHHHPGRIGGIYLLAGRFDVTPRTGRIRLSFICGALGLNLFFRAVRGYTI